MRIRPRLEALEARDVPATLFALTSVNTLVSFDSATPSTLIGTPLAITGLIGTDVVGGIDFRPSNNLLYGVATSGGGNIRIYTISTTTGVATAVNAAATASVLTGNQFAVDFNPVPDLIRVIDLAGNSTRFTPGTGGLAGTDTDIFYDTVDNPDPDVVDNVDFFGSAGAIPATISVAAAGYTNGAGTAVTTLYGIDTTADILVRIGGADGPPSPSTGAATATALAYLTDPGLATVDFGPNATLDIQFGTDAAFASNNTELYSVNLSTGTTTSLGTIGTGAFTITGLAIAPPAAGAGTLSLPASTFAFGANRAPVAVTVTRTGGSTGPVSVDYATADGTGVAGVDYLPNSGTLSFAAGQTERTIFLQVPAGTPANGPAKTFTLTLSNATGGASLGATTSATVTIPAVSATPNRFFAAGGSAEARVTVYDTNGGNALFSFRAFEGNFGGEAHVAVGDVNGDGFDDVIVGAGPGAASRIQVLDGRTLSASNQTQLASFFAFDVGFIGGVSVASGDVNGDGFDDVIVGAGPGAGAHVKVFDVSGGGGLEVASYFAYTGFNGGVTVSSGNFDGDSFDDVITGSGTGSHVKVFDGSSLTARGQAELASFFAFDAGFISGIAVSGGDINGDSFDDVVVGANAGTGGNVKVYNGIAVRNGSPQELASFFAFDTAFLGGANVSSRDIDRDGFDDLIVGAGPGGGSSVLLIDGESVLAGPRRILRAFAPFPSTFTGGVFVG